MPKKLPKKSWIVTVDMGYGHQRASFPLAHLAEGGIIAANNYDGIPKSDKRIWGGSRKFYEFISRFKKVPLIGEKAFELYDKLQGIPPFYPRRDLSKSNIQLKETYSLFEHQRWGEHLIKKLARKPLPFVTTFFATAMMAEYFEYPGEIFCVVCDTDISRAWAPLNPKASRINYFSPCRRVRDRLLLYGISPDRIFLTGFPLPLENVGDKARILKKDLGERLANLDPNHVYYDQYHDTILEQLGKSNVRKKPTRPITITFAVGGAGAQRELGAEILKSLRDSILHDKVRINLVAGVHPAVNLFFKKAIRQLGLAKKLNHGLDIIFQVAKDDYFREFNKILRKTDILWTKPSELSFYCALGIPIITAPPIGSQEIFNQRWLRSIGSGMKQDEPAFANEWLFDWLNSGWLAEAAMQGFLEAPKYGTYNIEKVIFHQTKEAKAVNTVLQY